MSVERLIAMANDIASYFESEPDRPVAVAGVATHIRRYWVPRMREQIVAHLEEGGAGLDELARAGLERLATQASATIVARAQEVDR